MFAIFTWLVISILLMSIAEYWIHRSLMHKPRLGKTGPLKSVYQDHAVEHHGKHRNDLNIDMPLYNHLTIGSPALILFYLLGGYIAVTCLLSVFVFHSYTWTKLHRAIHSLEDNWMGRSWFFKYFYNHHVGHHDRPNKNYGVVFIFTDYIFGTKA